MPQRLQPVNDRPVKAPRPGVPLSTQESGASGLVVAGVSKNWIDRRRTALQDVDLALDRGSTAAIVGANGSGKTTMLRVIAGLIRPDSGVVSLNGLDSERDSRRYRARIGYLSAGNSGLFARLSVRRQLDYAARLAFMGKREARQAVGRALDAFALEDVASRRVDRLSLGQRQRVRAALAFLHRPDLVLLDEPHNSLDEPGLLLVRDAVRDLAARGGVALWCAPAIMEQDGGFDRTFVMRAGRLGPA